MGMCVIHTSVCSINIVILIFLAYVIARMDPNSSYLLRIKLVGNKRKTRQDLGCYSFTKVVDADTTNFKDFVE
jgi:hypothetical protein